MKARIFFFAVYLLLLLFLVELMRDFCRFVLFHHSLDFLFSYFFTSLPHSFFFAHFFSHSLSFVVMFIDAMRGTVFKFFFRLWWLSSLHHFRSLRFHSISLFSLLTNSIEKKNIIVCLKYMSSVFFRSLFITLLHNNEFDSIWIMNCQKFYSSTTNNKSRNRAQTQTYENKSKFHVN